MIQLTHAYVTNLDVFLFPVVFDLFPYDRALGMPEHQSASRVFLYGEQLQSPAQGTMVSLLGLLHLQFVRLQLFLSFPCSAVYPLYR